MTNPPPNPWIYRPWVDLLIGCGAWSAPLLLLGFYAASSHDRAWSMGFYFLALLFNYPHFMATVYRAYHTETEFTKYRIFTVHVALLLAVAGVLAHFWYPLLPWIFTVYICWSPWHYTGQNFGLLMMFARRSGLHPTAAERRAIHLAFLASYVMLMLSFHTGPSGDTMILSLGLPAKFTLPARAALAGFFMLASGWALTSLARRSTVRTIMAPLTLALTQFLWFLLPVLIELGSGREVPQTRYSSGILAVLHSAQYLWITSYFQEREARESGNVRWKSWRYFLTLVAGGIALFIPGPWLVSRLFHADFAASFLTFTALVNIHHFILDGALWKLRDSRIASFLLNSQEPALASEPGKRNSVRRVAHWIASGARGAQALRIATVAVLLGWGALDQLHFYWSGTKNIEALRHAVQLNPDDSVAQLRLARAEKLAGDVESSLASLQRAAALSSGNLSLQQAYARGLIEAGRKTEAYNQYQTILARWNRDADSLVNSGLLAQQFGHGDEAIEDWQRAVDVAPAQTSAQLYLAQALDHRGEVQAAARHYRAYLEIVSTHSEEHRSEATTVLAALLKVADADAAANRIDSAYRGYKSAAGFAENSADKTLQSLALVHLAELEERRGEAAEAALDFQKALRLDASLSDPRSAASDWFNYGQFLRRQQQPEKLVFACFLQAEELVSAIPGDELSAIVHARMESEKLLAREAATVRRLKREMANEALSLPSSRFSRAKS
ncbi:MAG TPA: hypothetical protein VK525_09925 [Candidatus Saccharimonadales bacterium]|nr:hypothetical protein [Candidatus Saccharimonadales bacterium]